MRFRQTSPRILQILLLVISAGALGGCATPQDRTLYSWGDYQPLIYQMYAKPGTADPSVQVAKLSADIEKARGEGKRIPPGEHAQLGYMQYLQGNPNEAVAQFKTERELYPESGTFIGTILTQLKAGQ